MKHILILAMALMGLSFGQIGFGSGAVSGIIRFTGTNTVTTIGHIPSGAVIVGAAIAWDARVTNLTVTNSISIGISNVQGFILPTTTMPLFGNILIPTTLSNTGFVYSRSKPTLINGYLTTTGPAFGTNGSARVIITYLQVPQ